MPKAQGNQMIHCPHRHPMGESYCTACQQDKAKVSERQKILDLINQRLTEAHSREIRMMLLRLKDDIK
jgi:hypothetical protein